MSASPAYINTASALAAAVAVGISALPCLILESYGASYSILLIAAPCMATVTFWDRRTLTALSLAIMLFSVWLAFGAGMIVHFITESAHPGGEFNRVWGCLLLLPFSTLLSFGLPEARSKMGSIPNADHIACLAYIPAAFYRTSPYVEGSIIAASITFGCLISWVLATALGKVPFLHYENPSVGDQFTSRAANLFECLTEYFYTINEHTGEIALAKENFEAICLDLSKAEVAPELMPIYSGMAAELFALKESVVNGGPFGDELFGLLWRPMAADVGKLQSTVTHALRTAKGQDLSSSGANDIKELDGVIKGFECRMRTVLAELTTSTANRSVELDDYARRNTPRFYYAMGSLLLFSNLALRYRQVCADVAKHSTAREASTKGTPITTKIPAEVSTLREELLAWLMEPFFTDLTDIRDLWSRCRAPLRFALVLFTITVGVIIGGKYSAAFRACGLWASVPVYTCFLPTVGESLLKGTRGVLGMMLAGLFAIYCIWANPGNKAAFYCELIMVSFIGQLAAGCPKLGYVGINFVYMWILVGFASLMTPLPPDELLTLSLWRLIFAVGGAVIMLLSSGLIFPTYAMDGLVASSANGITHVSVGTSSELQNVISWANKQGDVNRSDSAHDDNKFEEECGYFVFQSLALRAKQRTDAIAEMRLYDGLSVPKDREKLLIDHQKAIDSIELHALTLHDSLVRVTQQQHRNLALSRMLSPFWSMLENLADALRDSGTRIALKVESGSSSAEGLPVNEKLKESVEVMDKLRGYLYNDLLDGAIVVTNLAMSGIIAYHACNSLRLFAQSWTDLEAAVLGQRQAPISNVMSSQEASSTTEDYKMAAFKNAMENKNATRADKFIALNHAHSAVVAKMQSLDTDEERKAIEEAFVKEQNRCLRLQRKRCTTDDFEVIRTIGQGAFGVVRVVRHKEDKEIYALKQMPKKSMKKKNQRDRVVAEKCLLSRMEDTWVGTLYQTFQDEDNLYMVMEFLPGGDMMSHLIRLDIFSEYQTKFYIAELVEALHSVHKLGYIHRDIKPDNIAFTSKGHLKLLDFGLCKFDECIKKAERDPVDLGLGDIFTAGKDGEGEDSPTKHRPHSGEIRHLDRARLKSSVGTPQYMAPEVFMRNYDQAADFWSVGVIMYECLMGGVPFADSRNSPDRIMQKVMNYRRYLHIPYPGKKMSPEAEDFLKKILCDKEQRLTYKQIRNHPYFKGLDWDRLHDMEPPIKPQVFSIADRGGNFDKFSEVPLPSYKPSGQRKDKNLDYVGYTYKKGDDVPDVTAILEAAAIHNKSFN
ncbi:hypothetical protein FOL47_005897 [Perkinsus chesapeaki]|uniref:non-specific serine/threonine protein kinase n=1 Tax=Perkinsus chesapeaki TaxID=330153 RepID=A0A7J6LUW8_PERCH|nr:hypothetical protein FOL47_005897 [Perkinsus chesapeaki]